MADTRLLLNGLRDRARTDRTMPPWLVLVPTALVLVPLGVLVVRLVEMAQGMASLLATGMDDSLAGGSSQVSTTTSEMDALTTRMTDLFSASVLATVSLALALLLMAWIVWRLVRARDGHFARMAWVAAEASRRPEGEQARPPATASVVPDMQELARPRGAGVWVIIWLAGTVIGGFAMRLAAPLIAAALLVTGWYLLEEDYRRHAAQEAELLTALKADGRLPDTAQVTVPPPPKLGTAIAWCLLTGGLTCPLWVWEAIAHTNRHFAEHARWEAEAEALLAAAK